MELDDKKCYYEILEVDKKVSQNDLKKSYKKLALKYHPDKAPTDQQVEYKQYFQTINEAFQVLSDPQERAWYDSHRDQFLNPDREKNYTGFDFDINEYFSENCYKKKNEEETIKNFYKVYQDVFIKILIEEERARENDPNLEEFKESHLKAPNFGDQDTDLENIGKFYDYWDNFSTSLNFTWADVWDVRDGENRRVKRLIERENKRARAKAKKKYYDLLKRLISFVKSRDERYNALLNKIQQEKQAKKKQEEEQKLKNEQEWQKQKQNLLQQEMAQYEKERQERLDNGEIEEEDINEQEILIYECKICNKEFQSENQYKNHQKSKQHLKRKKKMMKDLLANGEEFYLDQIDDEIQNLNKKEEQPIKSKKKKKKKKKQNFNTISTTIDDINIQIESQQNTLEQIEREEQFKKDHEEWQKKQQLKKQKKQTKKQKRQERKQKKDQECRLCGFQAQSKTQLFKHLESEHNHQLIQKKLFLIKFKQFKQYQIIQMNNLEEIELNLQDIPRQKVDVTNRKMEMYLPELRKIKSESQKLALKVSTNMKDDHKQLVDQIYQDAAQQLEMNRASLHQTIENDVEFEKLKEAYLKGDKQIVTKGLVEEKRQILINKKAHIIKLLEKIDFNQLINVKERKDKQNFFDSYMRVWIWILEVIYGYPRSKFYWPEFVKKAIKVDQGEDLKRRMIMKNYGKLNNTEISELFEIVKVHSNVYKSEYENDFPEINKLNEILKSILDFAEQEKDYEEYKDKYVDENDVNMVKEERLNEIDNKIQLNKVKYGVLSEMNNFLSLVAREFHK